MGCGCSKDDDYDEYDEAGYEDKQPHHIGQGVALMMQQAGMFMGATANMEQLEIDRQIRKAKAEGKTVTLLEGSLYFDYQFVARIPPGMDVRV